MPNHALAAGNPRREFVAEIEKARQDDDNLLRQPGGSHELAGVDCDDRGEAIRAEDDAVENPVGAHAASRGVLQGLDEMTCGQLS